MKESVVITKKGPRPEGFTKVILWDDFCKNDIGGNLDISLPALVEKDAELLRREYLEWTYKLSFSEINGKTLSEMQEISKGVSAWWCGVLVEKSVYKTAEIYDVIRLRALELYLEGIEINYLVLSIGDETLHRILKYWCTEKNINYRWEYERKIARRSLKDFMPGCFLATIFYMRYIWQNLAFIRSKSPLGGESLVESGLTIFSYFDNLDKSRIDAGKFGSLYWGELPRAFDEWRKTSNWIFRFIPSLLCPNAKSAMKLIKKFSESSDSLIRFFLLEQWLNLTVLIHALFIYFSIWYKGPPEKLVLNLFQFKNSSLNFWPLMRSTWRSQNSGVSAMENALSLALFSRFCREIPLQAGAICLAEYQGWERALLQYWRKCKHGKMAGFVHSTIRFFDFRYCEYSDGRTQHAPRYDEVLVGGELWQNAMRSSNDRSLKIIKVEALRYQYLAEEIRLRKTRYFAHPRTVELLVLTDYDKSATIAQIEILGQFQLQISHCLNVRIIIKPHPNRSVCAIAASLLEPNSYKITNAPLTSLLESTDFAFASNFTSASLETVYAKIPTAISLTGEQINMSPLRGVVGVKFVTNATELCEAINTLESSIDSNKFFYLNRELPLWRAALA